MLKKGNNKVLTEIEFLNKISSVLMERGSTNNMTQANHVKMMILARLRELKNKKEYCLEDLNADFDWLVSSQSYEDFKSLIVGLFNKRLGDDL